MEERAEVNFNGREDGAKYMCMEEGTDGISDGCEDGVKHNDVLYRERDRGEFRRVRRQGEIFEI